MAASPAIVRFRIVLWALVVVAAIGATALYVFRPPAQPMGVTGTPFTLESTAGGTFTQNDLRGTPSLVFFGYTHCPDVCPTTMAESAAWREELALGPEALRTLFITVDPERDTRDLLAGYVSAFGDGIVGLVGTPEETEAAKRAFGAMSEKGEPDEHGYYLVNHTASVFLIDADGRFQGTIAYGEDTGTAIAKIRRLVGV